MMFGLTQVQYEYIFQTVVKPIKSNLDTEVYCYGSRARGDHGEFSDLDLMVESKQDYSSQLALIKEELTKGNFPYKVDLVQFKDFAQSYISSYEKDKTLFY